MGRVAPVSLIILNTICHYMPCKIECNDCELEQRISDCVTAHKRAKEHEAEYSDHFVTLYDRSTG